MKSLICALVVAALSVGGPCFADKGLENVYWRAKVLDKAPISLAPQQVPHVAFHGEENRVAGFSGCNRFFASYAQNGDELTIQIMGGGRAQCPDLGDLEQRFMLALQRATRFSVEEKILTLFADDEELLSFVGIEQ